MATTTSSKSSKLAWERFEELAKVAFVADPHADTRFFFKTRVVPRTSSSNTNKRANGAGVKIVARVSTRPRKNSSNSGGGAARITAQSITYQTPLVSNLSRLTRLLRFVMQEVLGPMKPTTAVSAPLSASHSSSGGTQAAPPQPDASADTTSKTNKSGNKTKKKKK